jgi:hypothetical protein
MIKKFYTGVTSSTNQLIDANSTIVTFISVNPTSAGTAYLVDGTTSAGTKVAIFNARENLNLQVGTASGLQLANGAFFLVASGTWDVCVSTE